MLSPGLSLRLLHSTTACTVRWGFVIAVLPSWFQRHHPGHQAVRICGRITLFPLCFDPAHMPAHARSADALQFLRSHALQPAHDDSMTAFAEVCATACLGHAVRLSTHSPFSASLVSYEAIYMHAHCSRMHAPPPHCSSRARMLLGACARMV